jgi:hypothetical protein
VSAPVLYGDTERTSAPKLFTKKEIATVENPGPFRETEITNMDAQVLIIDPQRASMYSSVFFAEMERTTMDAPVGFTYSMKVTMDTAVLFRETQRTTAPCSKCNNSLSETRSSGRYRI